MKNEKLKKELIFQKLKIESSIRMVNKIKEVMGIFDESKLNYYLDKYNEILKELKKLD
ncbi:MAG: hypothetical protein RSA66_09245 [Muribaculaceae bacterium]